jgi:hypothetical protein
MSTGILFDCAFIVGFALLALNALDRKRIRAPWAKLLFMICAVVGIAKGGIGLAWDLGWFTLATEASRRLDGYSYLVGGLLLGFLISLIVSGELLGHKATGQRTDEQTA